MNIEKTKIPGVIILNPTKFVDNRGYFTKLFDINISDSLKYKIKEINSSYTKKKGTIRGMHLQGGNMQQDKIVQCVKGSIYDVAIDLRESSPTYKQWVAEELSGTKMLLVPKGCAHGFQSLEDDVIIQYFVSEHYDKESEYGVRYNDPAFNVEWKIEDIFTSEKDAKWAYWNK